MAARMLAALAVGLLHWTASGSDIHPGVDMAMKIQNLDYDLLVGNRTLLDLFVGQMETGISAAANSSVAPRHVWLTLSRGSGFIWVNWNIVPPSSVTPESVQALLSRPGTDQLLTEYALNMTGLEQAAVGGSLQVTHVTTPSVVVDAPLPAPAPAPTLNTSRYTRVSLWQDCGAADFSVPTVDFPQEVVVWMAYLGYVIVITIVILGGFYCCTHICKQKLKRRVMVFEEEPPEPAETPADDKSPSKADKSPSKVSEPVTPVQLDDDDEYADLRVDLPAAEKHLKATSVTDAMGKWRSVFFTRIDEMSEIGGNGTELYFRLLRLLGFTFFFMGGLTAPTFIIGLHGDFAPDLGGELAKTTIGNTGIWEDGGLAEQEARYVPVPFLGCKLLPASTVTKFFAWFDFGATLLFLTVIAYFRFYRVPHTVKVSDRESITCRDYTLEVDQLPPEVEDMSTYEAQFRDHIMSCLSVIEERKKRRDERIKKVSKRVDAFETSSLPAEITEVVLVRDYSGRLGAIKSRAELVSQLRLAEFRADEKATAKLRKKVDALSDKLKEQLKPENELPVVRAYVTLNMPNHARDLAFYYRFSVNPVFRRCQFKQKRFLDRAIRVQKAPEPSNIIWENQDLGYVSRMLRKATTTVVFFLLIFISMALIWVTLASSSAQSGTSQSYLGDDTCDPVYRAAASSTTGTEFKCLVTQAEAWTVQEAQASAEHLDCWCLTQGYGKIIQDSVVRSACAPWLADVAKKVAIMGSASLVVVIINIILQITLVWLAEFERSSSISGKDSSVMFKIAVAQTLNTGAVPLIVNFSAPQAVQDFVKVIPGLQFVGQGDYRDFVRGWYTVVGLSLLVSMLANAFTMAASNAFFAIYTFAYRWCCTRRRCLRAFAQTELLELFTNPVFDISIRYAQLIMTVFVTLMYSSGLPLLNFFAAIYMFMMYWVDKYVLLRASKRPPFYDTQMPSKASQSMIYAVPLHCLFAVMMFGQPCTFPSNPLGGTLGSLSGSGLSATSVGDNSFVARLNRESTWMLVGLLAIFLTGWVVWTLLWVFALDAIWRYLKRVVCGIKTTLSEDLEGLTWDKAKVHIDRSYPPASYKLERHPAFRKLAMYITGNSWNSGTWRNQTGTSSTAGWRPTTPGGRSDAAVCSEEHPGPEALNDPDLASAGAGAPSPVHAMDESCEDAEPILAEALRRHPSEEDVQAHVEQDLAVEDSSSRSMMASGGLAAAEPTAPSPKPVDPAAPGYPPPPPDSVAVSVDAEVAQLKGSQQPEAPRLAPEGAGGPSAGGQKSEDLRAVAAAESVQAPKLEEP